jgi:hypothetical protein
MMIDKKKITSTLKIYGLLLLSMIFIASGCKKFLGHDPDNRINLSTNEDLSLLLTSAYPQADFQTFTEAASDNVKDKGTGDQYRSIKENTEAFLFKEDIESIDPGSPTFYWKACYKAIATANQALAIIDKAANPGLFKVQKGEALLCRAYAHFQLVSLFSKSYNPSTAAADPGIPYVTEVETVVLKNYERKTVQYVYDNIEKDLLDGLPLIDETSYLVKKYHFNKDASLAFASRFYLFKRDYQKSLAYSKKVLLGKDLFEFVSLTDYQYERNLTIAEAQAIQNRASESSRLLLAEARSNYGADYYNSRYGLTPALTVKILNNSIFAKSPNVSGGGYRFPMYSSGGDNNALLRYFPYERRTSVTSPVGEYYTVFALFTVEEIIFNIIECNIQLGNYAQAYIDLNKYIKLRMDYKSKPLNDAVVLKFYKTTDIKQGLLNTSLDFKRGEFVQMGLRWFDILRYQLPVVHDPINLSFKIVIAPDDPRKVFQLPLDTKYSNLERNKR